MQAQTQRTAVKDDAEREREPVEREAQLVATSRRARNTYCGELDDQTIADQLLHTLPTVGEADLADLIGIQPALRNTK